MSEGMLVVVVIHLRCRACERTNKFLPLPGRDGTNRLLQYLPCGHPDCSIMTPNYACNDHLREMPVKVKQEMWKLREPWDKHDFVRSHFGGAPEPEPKPKKSRYLV